MNEQERLKTTIVGPDGPLTAQMCFVGQAPGREEDEQGVPFVGAAGRLLNQRLRVVGVPRTAVLVTNVFCQRPPKNEVGYYFSDAKLTKLTWEGQEHVDRLERWLKKLLELRTQSGVGPNVLVALGREAMMVLTGKHRITKWRGSVLPCILVPGFKVYVTFHPSYVQRLMNERPEALVGQKKVQAQNVLPLFTKDLERALEQSRFPELRYPERTYKIAETLGVALEELEKLRGEPMVSVDIETLRGDDGPLLWTVGFAPRPGYAFTVPFIKGLRPCWSMLEEAQVLRAISEFFLSPSLKIFQGGSYDLSVLGRYYGLRVADGTYGDTMLCHHASYPYLRKALEVLVSVHTWEPYYKDDGKVWDGRRISDEAEFLYNCKDCAVTREILPLELTDARELGTIRGYERTMEVFPSVLYMQLRGVKIDLERKAAYTEELRAKASTAERTIQFLANKPININSSDQIIRLLYTDYNMPIQYNAKTKRPTADKHAIQKLVKKYRDPESHERKLLDALLEYRLVEKLRSTYAEMEVDSDGRIHTSYGWISTWRLSSSESHFGKGGNLQNIPARTEEGREIRKLFVADEGRILLAADYKQIEAMIVAWLARDKRLIELYQSGVDVHWERTKDAFGFPLDLPYDKGLLWEHPWLDEPYPLKWFRDLGKRIVHASNYKMGFRKLSEILLTEGIYVPEKVCRQAMVAFKQRNPLTVQWQNRVEETIRRSRTLVTPLGRKREFRGRLDDDMIRSAVAFVPQSTAGEMTQIAAKRMLECEEFELLLNVHDENLGQCLPERVELCSRALKEASRIPLLIEGQELIVPIDLKSGPNWGEMKEI